MSAVLRSLVESDLPHLAALNDAAAPAVNVLGLDGLVAHVPTCDLALVAEVDGTPAAMLLALAPGAAYASENYVWFSMHRPGSLYVDRVVVAPHASGAYQNYLDPGLRGWRGAYYGRNLARLERVRAAYDPDRRFRSPRGI